MSEPTPTVYIGRTYQDALQACRYDGFSGYGRDTVLISTNMPDAWLKLRGLLLDDTGVHWVGEAWRGQYAQEVELAIRAATRAEDGEG